MEDIEKFSVINLLSSQLTQKNNFVTEQTVWNNIKKLNEEYGIH